MSLVDGRLAVSRLPNAADILLSVAAMRVLFPELPLLSLISFAHLSICRFLLVHSLVLLALEPSFLQRTSTLSFDPALSSGDRPSREFAHLVVHAQS